MKVSREIVLGLFDRRPNEALSLSAIMTQGRFASKSRRAVQRVLRDLVEGGRLILQRNRRYVLASTKQNLVTGKLVVNPRGFGFVRHGESKSASKADVYIRADRLGEAMHGDLVVAQLSPRSNPARPEGSIISVLERGVETLVGRFHRSGRSSGFVVPRERRIKRNVDIVAAPAPDDAPDESWVVVRLREYPTPPDNLIGEIVEVLGDDATPGIDVLMILRDYGVRPEFPDEVETAANKLPDPTDEDGVVVDIGGRTDFRDWPTVTIDGYDAKDFDDALSIEAKPAGGWRLAVHIADVAHYVEARSEIDAEALARTTSIYPVDRVVPMLPERLSNDLCSLRPNVDRLTMSVVMDLSSEGDVDDYTLHNSVIRSRHRLTYRDTQAFFDGIDNPATRRLRKVAGELQSLLELMRVLRRRRLGRGALDLDLPEVEIEFDEDGAIDNVVRAPRWESHQVVEECMILANEVVGRRLEEEETPTLYRVHDKPEREGVEKLIPILKPFGVKMSTRSKKPVSEQFQDAIAAVAQLDAGHILQRVILRALTEARYQHKNIGHFGLASECYTHFTSPIRRYPDLLVHRALKRLIADGHPDREWLEERRTAMPALGLYTSEQERRASSIEDEATRLCALEFMRRHLGETFMGHIAGVANFGLFIELRKFPVEGLLHIRDLHDDHYDYDEASLTLRGQRSGRRFTMGQPVEVIVHRVDTVNQEMDFRLALLEERRPGRGGRLYQSRRRPRGW